MKKLIKYNKIQIFIDEDFGNFHFKIADRDFNETSLNIAKARIDEQLEKLNPMDMACLYYDGWSSSGIKEIRIVRKTEAYAFDEDGESYELERIYEYTKENLEIAKKAKEENNKGWKILRNSERIGKSMSKEKFPDAHEGEDNGKN